MPALLDAIEKELAAEEAKLSMGSTVPGSERIPSYKPTQNAGTPVAQQPLLAAAAKEAQLGDLAMSPSVGTDIAGQSGHSASPTRAPRGLSRAGPR